jgi:signal transduction histidine kinase
MTLARKNVMLLIALLALALAGLLAVEAHLLAQTFQARRQALDRNVATALAAVTRTVESAEIAHEAETVLREFPGHIDSLRVIRHGAALPLMFCPDSLFVDVDDVRVSGDHGWQIAALDLSGRADSLAWRGWRAVTGDVPATSSYTRVVAEGPGSDRRMVIMINAERGDLVGRVIRDLNGAAPRSVAERLDAARIDSLLHAELARVGVDTRVEFAVSEAGRDSLVLVSDPDRTAALRASPHRAALFPLGMRPPFAELIVDLPAGRALVWRSMAPLLVATFAFAALIVASFSQAVRTILAQRRLTTRTVDFINNMTHEFKTPLATVALAREALARPDVRMDPDAVDRYLDMIRDENARMHGQVERILQMAHLEAGDLSLARGAVDLHGVVADAARTLALGVEQRGGELEVRLDARRRLVRGDAVHLRGVVANLLDNALKYSPGRPRITIATRDDGDAVLLSVADRGIGIAPADRAQVFEKYYRSPTGDRHDVKGFGLGLSYVKLMVEAHGGTVALASRRGEGTEVRVRLPVLDGTADARDPASHPARGTVDGDADGGNGGNGATSAGGKE